MTDKLIDQQTAQPAAASQQSDGMVILFAVVLLLTFGVTMLVFSLFYVRDIQVISELPGMVWAFICGRPSEDGIVLPVLVLISTMAFMGAAGLGGWRWLQTRR
ncbi:MAG: hypothetical protein GYB67_18810 [Chloroflexi bacterium]|nr:hypothetical protein [Chloroflexota bacterium]